MNYYSMVPGISKEHSMFLRIVVCFYNPEEGREDVWSNGICLLL